jgi:hypothetical protein
VVHEREQGAQRIVSLTGHTHGNTIERIVFMSTVGESGRMHLIYLIGGNCDSMEGEGFVVLERGKDVAGARRGLRGSERGVGG